jgi:outer membrane receptor protein involved in Fe transport
LGNAVIVPYKAETAWSYELGFKGTFWKRVRFKSALFYINYENRLFQTNVYESGNFVNVTENIGESKNYGVEFDLTLPLTKELLFSVNYGYTKAVWGNVPIYDSDLSAYTNLSGRLAPFTPQYQATVSLDWNHQLPDGYIIGARADANFIGRTYWDVTDHYWQAAYQVVNFGLRFGKGPWEASAHVFNALDERYNTVWISGPELGAPFNVGGIGRPRLYTMQFTYKF